MCLKIMENEEDPEMKNGFILWAKDLNVYICNYFLKDKPICLRVWVTGGLSSIYCA